MKKKPLINGLPADFVHRIQEQFPDQEQQILSSFRQRPPVLRVNTLLISPEELRSELKEEGIELDPIPLLPQAFLAASTDRKTLTSTDAYQKGLFYIQSIASQLAVKALDPQPGEYILDLCSAPGSKTTQIAIAMSKQGELLANDNNRKRIYRLQANLKHQQVEDFVEVKNYSGQNYPKFYPEAFDQILVDAPCSSESRFDTRYPKSINFWSRHKVKATAKIQRRLLSAAVQCAKPGATIVYSTCTLSPEENELVMSWVLNKHPELVVQPLKWDLEILPILKQWNDKPVDPQVQGAIRLMPTETVEPFFICRLLKQPKERKERE